MQSCPTQAVLPLVGLAADRITRDWYITEPRSVALQRPSQHTSEHHQNRGPP
ncbi:MAG: hypothetical protein ACQESR_09545 [Planctomycetota bacterium]